MGRSSSKRTSSKRKTSKPHSEARKKKKNKTTKSKKTRSRKDYSSSSSDDSKSLVSISSSSSEDEHYRSRSRKKSKLKGSKKRSRERSSTKRYRVSTIKKPHKKKLKQESSFTSLSSDSYSYSTDTKKKFPKKRQKREHSVDSIASHSHSCSTCFGSDESRELESRWERVGEKSKEKREFSKTKRLKVRSRSCSPDNRNNDETDSSFPIVPTENSSRRLRSVIVAVKQPEDDIKEQMVQNTDVDNKRALDNSSYINPEIRDFEILKTDEASASDLKSSEVSPVLPNTETDLESMLRLKALENMIKYKGAQIEKFKAPTKSHTPLTIKDEPNIIPKKIQKANSVVPENPVNAKSAISSESVPNESKGRDSIYMDDPVLKVPSLRRLGGSDVRSLSPVSKGQDSNVLKSSVSDPGIIPNKAHNAKEQASKNSGRNIIYKSSISEPTKNITDEEQSVNSSVAVRTVNSKVDLTTVGLGKASEKDEQDDPKSNISEPSSSTKPELEKNSSKDDQSTDKDGSQFQQKTMSVMRGGEMVEVSYKVYIPKKAPALARRPLIRR